MPDARTVASRLLRRVQAFSAWPIDRLLHRAARRRALAPELAPIFLVGAPRTGSTILYQSLSSVYDVLYIDNLACRWCDRLLFAVWLSRLVYGDRPHGCFQAEFGRTRGGHAPSECGRFWYRWLPRDRHYVGAADVEQCTVEAIRTEIEACSRLYGRPMLFKNLNAGQRIGLLRRCFPRARFVFVRRDHERTVASILAARQRMAIGEGQWWSVMPRDHQLLLALPEEAMVRAQVERIEAQIEHDLAALPASDWREIRTDTLTFDAVQDLADWLGLARRAGASLPPLPGSDRSRQDAETMA